MTLPSVTISRAKESEGVAFLAAVARSRDLHAGWVSPPSTAAAFAKYIRRMSGDDHASFWVRPLDDDAIAGVINISHIIPEPLASAFLGFYAFAPYAGHGYMKAGLRQVISHAFDRLGLHRLEANIQPENLASIALVRSCGFRREGFTPRYLRIDGQWRDHERWAILADENHS